MKKAFFSIFGGNKPKTGVQQIENEILNNIVDKLNQLNTIISEVVKLNMKETKTKDPTTSIEYKTEEASKILDILELLGDIYLNSKIYLEEYIKEINSDKYISPDKKYSIISLIRSRLRTVKQKLDRIFVEMEFLLQKI